MKKICFFILACAFCITALHAQETVEVTRTHLSTLFANAQKAERENRYDDALQIYKSILFIDDKQATPYLKMANLYSKDLSNAENVSLAIEFYGKYLELDTKGSNRAAIAGKIADLRQLMVENNWQQQNVNLVEILQSGQEEIKKTILAVAHPALKANTKEEIVQQVDDVNTLYNKAQATISSGNVQGSIEYLEQLLAMSDPTSPLYTQANMQLAEMYGKQGNVQKMQEILAAVEESMKINKNLSLYLNTKIKDATPFEDDICGVWVSDLSYNKAVVPYIVLKISKAANGTYNAVIYSFNPYIDLFSGSNIDYKMSGDMDLFNSKKSVLSNNGIAFVFGDENLPQRMSGMGQVLVNAGIDFVGSAGKSVSEGIIRKSGGSLEGQLGAAGVEIIAGGFQALIAQASIPVRISKYMDMKINRIYSGYAELELNQIYVREKGDNVNRLVESKKMRLAKLYPDYGIEFDFSYKEGSEQKNRQAYDNLTKKISDYCWIQSKDDPNMKIAASECITFFKYATQGLSYTKYATSDGYFEGWIDRDKKRQGFSKYVLNSGYEYIGEWNNDQYSGSGTLSYRENGTVISQYTGNFSKNLYNGKGLYHDKLLTYEGNFKKGKFNEHGTLTWNTGETFSGTWKNNIFKEGQGSYENGDFVGKWKYVKKEGRQQPNIHGTENVAMPYSLNPYPDAKNDIMSSMLLLMSRNLNTNKKAKEKPQKVPVPHGEGTFVNIDGESISGKWKNGVYQAEKQKINKKKVNNQ
jgi:outer membrane protein assembly factor BamD (BamD/ComL family)